MTINDIAADTDDAAGRVMINNIEDALVAQMKDIIPTWSGLDKESRRRELTTIVVLACHLLDFPLQRSQKTYSEATRVEVKPIVEARIGLGVESELCLLDLGDRWRIGYWNGEGWYDREGEPVQPLRYGLLPPVEAQLHTVP